MGTVSVPSSTLCLISGVAHGDICFLDRKRLEPKELLWQHHWRCHFVSLWCTFMVPSFKNTALMFLEILFIQYFTIFSCKQYDVITDHNRKTSISLKQKKIFQKEKRHSSVFWKAFLISRKYFSRHMHFECLAQEHNTMSSARARTQTSLSGSESSRH